MTTSVKRAQEAVREALELLELGDAFLQLDRSWRIVRVNANQERLSGLPRSRTVGRLFQEVWPELSNAGNAHWREYHRCMAERVPVQFQEYYAPRDLWTDVTAYPTEGGGVAVFFRDVSSQRRAEQALRRGEEHARAQAAQLEAVLDCVADGVIVYDRDGKTLRSTASADRILGIPPERRRAPVHERVAGQYEIRAEDGRLLAPEEMPAIRAALHGEHVTGVELSAAPVGGEPRWLRFNATPLSVDGRHAGAVLSMTDITGRKRTEDALRRHELVVRHTRDAILFIRRADGRILDANPAAVSTYGWGREELLARTIYDLRAPESRSLVDAQMALAGAQGLLFESLHQRQDGSVFPVEVSSTGALTFQGTPALVSVVRDITERKRALAERELASEALRDANERLLEADRRKDEFLGMLSHELRNPLAPIRNSIYVLRHSDPDGAQGRRARTVIERQVEHLTRLVDDLLDVTRIARGKVQLRRERIDLREVVVRAEEDIRLLMRDRGIAFQASTPDEAVWADADPTRVAQVVGNLLNNAAKFTPGGGRVTLMLRAAGGVAEIVVLDTGVGLDATLLPRVFEPFVQGERTLARTEGGLGLGLALVKGISELHGGSVGAESAGRGQGATFTIRLPVLAAEVAARRPLEEAVAGARVRRVLVVDDNADAAVSLADLVSLLGHEVDVAQDGPSALARVRASPPDVVLCDLGLPGMDGYEVARAIRAEGRAEIQLVAVSGYAQPEDVRRAIEAGFDAHVAKPADPDQIERLLAS